MVIRRPALGIDGSLLAALLVFTAYASAETPRPILRTLYSFTGGSDGGQPAATVIVSGGVLYGTTLYGGTSDYGVVYALTEPASPGGAWTETTLYNFAGGNDGAYPNANVVMGKDGILYGTTGGPGSLNTLGAVYSLTPPTSPGAPWTEATLYSFSGPSDGENPVAPVAIGSGPSGYPMLFGTTGFGGGCPANAWGCGTVFSLTPPAGAPAGGGVWPEAVLHYFDHLDGQRLPGDGSHPVAGVAIGQGGVLFGTTCDGGTNGYGTVFSLGSPESPGGAWNETIIHNFTGSGDGSGPCGGLVFGKDGLLYGATEYGGIAGAGTVFSITPPSARGGAWTETVLYNFAGGSDGQAPSAGVVIGQDGVLYGTTSQGGIRKSSCVFGSGCGTLFSLTPPASAGGAWTKATLYRFTGGSDGWGPDGGVFITKGGLLLGATEFGGSCQFCGTVFALEQ